MSEIKHANIHTDGYLLATLLKFYQHSFGCILLTNIVFCFKTSNHVLTLYLHDADAQSASPCFAGFCRPPPSSFSACF